MWRHVAVSFAIAYACAGCANLHVQKVNADNHLANTDDVRGFRYYLSRPYVIVKAPILVCENSRLYVVADRPGLPNLTSSDGNETIMRIDAASGAFENVSDEEVAMLRRLGANMEAVQQASCKNKQVMPPSPPVIQQPSNLVATLSLAPESGDALSVADVQSTTQATATKSGTTTTPGSGSPPSPDATVPPRKTAQVDGNIQIVFLPDLEEQYAVHNCNFLSKSTYTLNFNDGWQLTDVTGDFDSTPVPLEILNFIDTAIDSAKSVALAGVDRQARLLSMKDVSSQSKLAGPQTVYRLVTSTYLKPGIYRVNKPWEINHQHTVSGCGLLAKMGLATFETERIEINPTPRTITDVKLDVSVK